MSAFQFRLLTFCFLLLFLPLFFIQGHPGIILNILKNSIIGSWYDFGMTLFYATPLIFTGLSISMAYHGGLYNIGAEGQLLLGSLTAAIIGCTFTSIPQPLSWLFVILLAGSIAGLWSMLATYLKVKRGAHEVASMMMLNFIASGICSYVTLYLFKNPFTQNPETKTIQTQYGFALLDFFEGANVNIALLIALASCFLTWIFLFYTVWGYEIRATGMNIKAAHLAGISTTRMLLLCGFLSGFLASGVALHEVLGHSKCFILGFSPGYGFMGFAVALIANSHPLFIPLSAFLMAALHKCFIDLELETGIITPEVAFILQALVILYVSCIKALIEHKRASQYG